MSNSSPAPAGSYPEGNAENNAENVAKSFSPTRLYPRISVDPPAHPLVNEIKSEDLNEVIRDVNAVPQTNAGTDASTAADLENAAVEDVNQAINELPVEDANQPINKVPIEDVDQAINEVPIEQHVLLLPEPEDMEALSPYRQPSSDTEDNNELALVAPLRKKGKKNKAEGETTELGMSLLENGKTPLNPIIVGIETPKNDVRWWLYLAEIFGRWGDRMWTFTSALFLLELFPGSMLLPAIHGFITGLCVIMFGALIGEWVDRTPRLPAVRIALITQNSCVAFGSLILTFTFLFKESISDSGKLGCVFGFMLFAIVGDCASVAMNIIVEKDWVVVIAGGSKTDLADMNATIRRIDLTCQILSPIIIAQIMTFGAHYIGTIVVSVWNVLSMVAEYFILQKVYEQRPQLAVKASKSASSDQQPPAKRPLHRQIFRSCFAIRDGWQTYFKNRVAPAGIGLAFLYMTVLSFSGVTNTYVRTQGLSESVISIMMAVGAVTGIAGTFVFPILRQKVGLERTGLFALAFQLAFLCLCVISVWLPGTPFDPDFVRETQNETMIELMKEDRNSTQINSGKWITQPAEKLPSVFVFLIGMIGARFGLWMADLTITQLIQENVSEKDRGVIGGVQSSLNRFMDMLKFILVMFLPYPETFGILIIISFLFVCFGDCFYALYSYRTRGHLLPHCGPGPDLLNDRPNIVLSRREIVPSSI